MTAVKGEKFEELGDILYPSNTIGSASNQLVFLAMIADFKVRWNLSMIPLALGL